MNLTKNSFQVAIGTKNSAKIQAVESGFRKLFPGCNYKSFPVKVDSEVGDQPFGFESTIQGAINRAKNAFSKVFSEKSKIPIQLGVGIEAGMIPVPLTKTGYLDFQFCAIFRSDGAVSIGSGPAFEYPKPIVNTLLYETTHQEIGTIIESISGIKNIKEKEGAIGLFTKNIITRTDILEYSVITALLPLKNPDIYSE